MGSMDIVVGLHVVSVGLFRSVLGDFPSNDASRHDRSKGTAMDPSLYS